MLDTVNKLQEGAMKKFVIYETIRMGEILIPDDAIKIAGDAEEDFTISSQVFDYMEKNDCWPKEQEVIGHSVSFVGNVDAQG